mgnify:CR=1 FL=1
MRTLIASAMLALSISAPAQAASDSQLVKVTGLDFELNPGGFVRIWVDQSIVATANCQYPTIAYLHDTHPGFDTLVAALLTAHASGSDVILRVESSCWAEPWGSNAPRYQVRGVKLR